MRRRPRCPRCSGREIRFLGQLVTVRDPGGSTHDEATAECLLCRHTWQTRHPDLLRAFKLATRSPTLVERPRLTDGKGPA